MALSPRLDLRQSQSLVMTPQLQQAIKLLQLSNIELSAFVEQELEQNPLLEREDSDTSPAEAPPDGDGRVEAEPLLDASHSGEEAPLDIEVDNMWDNGPGDGAEAFAEWGRSAGRMDFDGGEDLIDLTVAREQSLREHLVEQVNMDMTDPADRMIAFHLMEMLDEAGYLRGDLAEVATTLACPLSRIEAVLARVQRFDPTGIFARSLSDCLALQLRERNRYDPAMEALLANLDLLARRDLPQLLRLCGVDAEDMAEMIAEIRALDPKPALAFDFTMAQAITPDVLMRPVPGGGWLVELNNDTLPRVLVNSRYYTMVTKSVRNKEEKSYLTERYQSANWLIKSLHQRANTILKVSSEIVRQQEGFFRFGIQHLKPLVLRDIAVAIGMHESTVSRVTANKYIATPRGIYELKYFFTQAISGSEGAESHSAEAVRHRIRALIDLEQPQEVLSDDRIVEILKGEGVDIARRTVAKYREALRIPSSVQRRREKAMSG